MRQISENSDQLKVIVAHPGTQYSFHLVRQLFERNMLCRFYTGIAFGENTLIYKLCSLLPEPLFKKISNRFIEDVPDHLIRRNIVNELRALILIKTGFNSEKTLFQRNKSFQNLIPDNELQKAKAVIGFDTSSWILAGRCKKLGKQFFLDVSIGHPLAKEKVYAEIRNKYPDWTFALKKKIKDHINLEQKEIELAYKIVVASTFTLNTYRNQNIISDKICVNPYGVDTEKFIPTVKGIRNILEFVFVGLVDARKGVPFLLNTMDLLKSDKIRLTLIGPVSNNVLAYINLNYPSVIVKGKLSFEQLKNILPKYDVLVFPSFFEGFGLVIPEAMASGLPVITTTATCGPDLLESGKDGFIIEPGNEVMLKSAIYKFVSQPELVVEMGKSARKKAENISWSAYGEKWQKILIASCEKKD